MHFLNFIGLTAAPPNAASLADPDSLQILLARASTPEQEAFIGNQAAGASCSVLAITA